MKLNKVLICGVGLIGGSFALALKASGAAGQVMGIGRTRTSLEQALELGVIDGIAESWKEAMQDADLALLAMPVGQMEVAMRALLPYLERKTVVTDAGSTKLDVIAAARTILAGRITQFVPGHPIAGAEKSGAAAASADLYRGKRVVLTPLAENENASAALVQSAWETCGARVDTLAPDAHDKVFAAVSHLPHVLAYALVHEIASHDNAGQLFAFAAGGFRDFTRIASSHPEMWRDICIANRAPLIAELDAYMASLLRMRTLLASADAEGLEQVFDAARKARDAWLQGLQPGTEE